jgi:hypothetical protein
MHIRRLLQAIPCLLAYVRLHTGLCTNTLYKVGGMGSSESESSSLDNVVEEHNVRRPINHGSLLIARRALGLQSSSGLS